MPVITLTSIEKSYGSRTVLSGVELTVRTGERVGVVGRNGTGKSTLARIVAGIEPPDQGTVMRRRGVRIEYLDQNPTFEDNPTAEQAVLTGLKEWHAAVERHRQLSTRLGHGHGDVESLVVEQAQAAEEVERLGGWERGHHVSAILDHIGLERRQAPVNELSGGERRRVALARLLVSSPELAILDEPTNHLDAETIEWLEEFLIDTYQGAILLVTHDRYLLDRVTTRTLEIADGRAYSFDGGYERYLEQKAEREAHQQRVEQNRQNFLRKELEWLRRMPKARTTKQSARIARAEDAIAQPKPKTEQTTQFAIDVARSGKTILEFHDASIAIESNTLIRKLQLFVREGDRIGIVGRNGTGKTTLLRAILGQLQPISGQVVIGANTKIAQLDQNRSNIDDSQTVFENAAGDQTRITLGAESIDPHQYVERFGFDRHAQRQQVASLSGGERARVALAKMLRQSANLLLLDEPTNDLDVQTLGSLESMLVDQGLTAMVVTHDRWFLDRVATAILAFEGDGKVTLYPGNFDTYRRLRAQNAATREKVETETASATAAKSSEPSKKAKKSGLTFREQKELEELPHEIDALDSKVGELTTHLSDPAIYTKGRDAIAEVQTKLELTRAELEQKMSRWELLERKKSESL
jgi:ABC transport system ATP-binding/permease protein